MKKDSSRQKSLFFLLQAVARQVGFKSVNQAQVHEAIKNLSVEDEDQFWLLSTTVGGSKNFIRVSKTQFSFYQTRSVEDNGPNPAEKNKTNAVEALTQLFQPYNFNHNMNLTTKVYSPKSRRDIVLKITLWIIFVFLCSQFDLTAIKNIALTSIFTHMLFNKRIRKSQEFYFSIFLSFFVLYYVLQSDEITIISAMILLASNIYRFLQPFLTNFIGRIIRTISLVLSLFVLFVNNPMQQNQYWTTLFSILLLNESLQNLSVKKYREFGLVFVSLFGVVSLIYLGVIVGNFSLPKLLFILLSELFLIFYGNSRSISRFLIPPAILLL